MEESEWKVVTKRSRPRPQIPNSNNFGVMTYESKQTSKRKATKVPKHSHKTPNEWKEQIDVIAANLEKTEWWLQVRTDLEQACGTIATKYLRCFGLGSFVVSSNARHQLACALLIQKNISSCSHCVISDPAMNEADKELVKLFGFGIEESHAQYLGIATKSYGTLFYMPHCSRNLFDKVLEENQATNFQRMIIFGNSLSRYADIRTKYTKRTIIDYLHDSKCFVERPCCSAKLSTSENAFNDLSVTTIVSPEQEGICDDKSQGCT